MTMNRRSLSCADDLAALLDDELFLKRGDYQGNISRWERIVDRSRILYIAFGDIRNDPERVIREVEQHIGLSEFNSYPKLHDTVHRSRKKGVDFPQGMLDQIHAICEPQLRYLRERFGAEFVERIK
jgi:hypothetical protein